MKIINILTSPIIFIRDRFFHEYPKEYKHIPENSGKVIERNGKKVAIYKNERGKILELSPFCTHLGCVVQWNDIDKKWDCPCHGASFTAEGKVIDGPARKELGEHTNFREEEYVIKITEITQLTHDVKKLKTTKPDGYIYSPGQATEVAIKKDGFQEKFRPFTFTSLNKDNYLEFTIKGYPTDKYPDHSGVTEKIHKLDVGDALIIKKPVGTIEYKGKGVFIAGGAGITPFIAIFRDLQENGKLVGNTLIFSNKGERDVILKDELQEQFSSENLHFTLTREKVKRYEYGRIDKDMIERKIDNYDQYFYICGPSGFEKDIVKALNELGVDSGNIVVEEW
jgi:ferredoxin-NADP reductase